MSTVEKLRSSNGVPLKWYVWVCGHAALAIALGLFLSVPSHAQVESETVEFDIPASTLPQALRAFARQSRVELVFAERGFDDVRTQAVVGTFPRERALELLLAGTGLQVGYGSGDSVIVQRADASESAVGVDSSEDPSMVLLAQAAVDDSQRTANDAGAYAGSDDSPLPADRSRAGGQTQALEEITVTGSRIRGAASASPIVTIDRAEIDTAGFATVEEVIEYLPQNFGAGASSDAFDVNARNVVGADVRADAGGVSVNLRGLGANSTLVLLNGRRMAPSGRTASFTNIGSIPVTAIERIEVMTDGASAIYGSDAIGGVINFILREDYEGAETRLRYGSDRTGDVSDVRFGQSFGTSWARGNVLFSYEYFDREALASSARAFTASSDLRPLGGTDWRQPGGSPANIRVGPPGARVFYAIPDGQDGTELTSADFVGLEGTQHLFNERQAIDVMPAVERHSGFLHLTQRVGPVELFGAARFSVEESAARDDNGLIVDFPNVTAASPHFVDPTGSGLTSVRVDNYSLFDELGPRIRFGEIDAFGATLGAQYEFFERWSSEFSLNWSREKSVRSRTNTVVFDDIAALVETVNLADPSLAFNPFSDGSNTNNRAILQQFALQSPEPDSLAENELWSVDLDVDGNVFELSGGTAQLAAGIGFRRESVLSTSFVSSGPQEADLSRDVTAVYAELFLPFVGGANSRPGLQRLEVSLAARHEDFNDFGSSTNPKLGVLWSPLQSLTLRGTIGTSYRAPSLTDLDDTTLSPIFYIAPIFLGEGIIYAQGRNPDLRAEEATTWTAGIQWTPQVIDGMSLDVTYFNVDFTGRIAAPANSLIAGITNPRFESALIRNPTPEQITRFVNSPNFAEGFFGEGSPEELISGAVPVDVIFDDRLTNLAESLVTGIEMQLSYAADTRLGTLALGFNGNYLLDFKRKLLSTDPLVDEVDTFGRPVDFRARGNITWRRNNWSISGFVNYTDSYTDNLSSLARVDDPQEVDSWTTVDVTVGFEAGSDAGLLSDAQLSLTTQNVFDEDPPFVDTFEGVGYDGVNASPLGRFFAFQLTKDW